MLLKIGAIFTKCITKIDGATIDDAEGLDLVLSIYNLLEYSWIYCDAAGSLRFFSKDEATNFNTNIANIIAIKSFMYKAKLVGEACNNFCTIKISK